MIFPLRTGEKLLKMKKKNNKKVIKHQEIFDAICNGILKGQYKPGELIPTEMQLAQQFNASRPTVGRAMRDLVSVLYYY